MLSHSTKTSYLSEVRSIGGIPGEHEFNNPQAPAPTLTFPLIWAKGNDKDEAGDSSSKNQEHNAKNSGSYAPDPLIPDQNFGEMLNNFFIVQHRQLLMIKSRIRREGHANSPDVLKSTSTKRFQNLRSHCYQVQMILYEIPKGNRYDLYL